MEGWVINKNTKIITTTIESKNEFVNKYGYQVENNITVIPNGFDEGLYAKIETARRNTSVKKEKKINFLYTGSLSQKRTPIFFLKAIQHLIKQKIILKNYFEIKFVGFVPLSHRNLINELDLGGVVNVIDPVYQDQLAEYYVTADLLLLFQRSSPLAGDDEHEALGREAA